MTYQNWKRFKIASSICSILLILCILPIIWHAAMSGISVTDNMRTYFYASSLISLFFIYKIDKSDNMVGLGNFISAIISCFIFGMYIWPLIICAALKPRVDLNEKPLA